MFNRLKSKLRHGRSPNPPVHYDPSLPSTVSDVSNPTNPPARPSGSASSVTKSNKLLASDQIGLFAIAESNADHGISPQPVDIIAIHGLNGHPYSTWTHPESGNMWLKDILPSYVPAGRVYTFGYGSKIVANQSIATVPDFARALLDSLRNLREEVGEASRSTIFVCHSLGGIVCKQALVFAHMDQKRYGSVLDSTTGIVFLGTPHCGSNVADLGDIVGRVVNMLSATATMGSMPSIIKRDLLNALAYDSRSLQELDISVRQILGKIMVTSFYELLPQPPLSTPVVSIQSAILGLPDEEPLPLHANHRDMCRFAHETSECVRVCQAIRRIQKVAGSRRTQTVTSRSSNSSSTRFNDIERSCMKLFSHFDLGDYKSRLPSPIRGTCAWIRSHPLFVSWAEKATSTMLWLTGHSGCGKTVLSYSVATRLEEGNQQVLVYFCDKKISSQQDGKAILIGLIFQLVQRNRRLIRHVRREFEICGANMVLSFSTLWSVFNHMIRELKGNLLYIVIDALDECEVSSCKTLLGAIRDLIDSSMSDGQSKTVKFLLTSRPMMLISGSDGEKEGFLEIDDGEQGYANDVRQFIHQRVDEVAVKLGCPEHTKHYLLNAMLSKAGNTFLWTHMILSSLEDSLLASAADLNSILASLPPSLESMYSSFLAKIPKGNLASAYRLLSLILASSRSLRLEEINYAFTITAHHQNPGEVLRDCQPDIARTLQGILGSLVRLSGQQVSLVHESVREFLLRPLVAAPGASSHEAYSGMPDITIQGAALQMATACILYLLLEDFETPNSSPELSPTTDTVCGSLCNAEDTSNHEHDVEFDAMDFMLFQEPDAIEADQSRDMASRHPFYDYAAKNWHHHYAVCEDIAPSELADSVTTLLEVDQAAGQMWRRYARSQALESGTDFPGEASSLVFACHLNLKGVSEGLLQHGKCAQQEKDEALFWSAKCGRGLIVSSLLEAGADPEYRGPDRQTALLAAAASGHTDCVKQLVGVGRCDVNVQGKYGRTALSLAAGNGHEELVKCLLNYGSTVADAGDFNGATPFTWAAGGGHLAILSALAKDRRVNVNSQDKNGRTALSWASAEGMENVVRHLLERTRGLDPNLQDKTGRTAFSWAAGNGHTGVLSLLIKKPKVDKYQPDHSKRSPISWACGQGREDALLLLLASTPLGLEDKDVDGWTPMAWVIHNDAPQMVEALFNAGARNLDEGPRTVLSWAMEYGHIAVVRMLLDKGADPETARDKIPFAQSMGRFDLVNELSRALNSKTPEIERSISMTKEA